MTPLRRTPLTALVLLTALGLFLPLAAALPAGAAPAPPAHGCASSVPYVSGLGGYHTYRIPAVVRTRQGTVLAFAEGRRYDAGDTGAIDVVLRRSTDGGCTWGPLTVVTPGDGDTRGNPAPVVDPRTGAVVLVTCGNSGAATEGEIMSGEGERRVYVQRSRDDGRRFSPPADITAQVKRSDWRWYATGPGHAVALTRGPHRGRLLVPANHSVAPPAGSSGSAGSGRDGGHALYSDDSGRTWHLGFVTDSTHGVTNVNETTAAQLPDGRLYFNARDQYGSAPGNRLDSYSGDGGRSLDRPYARQPSLSDVPVVQGSVLQLRGPGAPLLFSAPSVPTARRALALWTSTDAGRTFTKRLTLSDRPAAYSDLVQLGPATVGVLYETGTAGSYESLEFRRLDVPSLMPAAGP